jgi:hypothetical protein
MLSFSFVGFQPVHAGGSPSHDHDLPPADMFGSGVPITRGMSPLSSINTPSGRH